MSATESGGAAVAQKGGSGGTVACSRRVLECSPASGKARGEVGEGDDAGGGGGGGCREAGGRACGGARVRRKGGEAVASCEPEAARGDSATEGKR